MHEIAIWADQAIRAIANVIYGKEDVVRKILITLLCGGHVLLEDVPGVGKTILARAIAAVLGGTLERIQCTPDLLPSDVVGVTIFNQQTGEFVFRPGPIVANVLLVDEVNRATPRTQSAFLEAMEEGAITVDGTAVALPEPFFVIATENPVEFEGTFPLPEAQRDRFFMATRMGYPTPESEKEIMESQRRMSHPVTDLVATVDLAEVLRFRELVRDVVVSPECLAYILDLVEATRADVRLEIGCSPRASLALYQGAQASAALAGRSYATGDDVVSIAPSVMWKRVELTSDSALRGLTEERIIVDLIERIEIPVVEGIA